MARRYPVFTAAILAFAFFFCLSSAGLSQGRDSDDRRDNEVADRDNSDRGHLDSDDRFGRDVDVATVNLYVGADFTPIITAQSTPELLGAVVTAHNHILQSNFPARADALAREIVERRPDLVALQEVSLIRRQSPGDSIVGGTSPATTVELDYLAILLDALHRHGGHYAVVSQVQDTDLELPLATSPSTFDDIRLTDRDVILVRTDLPTFELRTSNPKSANYSVALPLPIGPALRGWCSVDVTVRGRSFRVINTHLEDRLPAGSPDIQFLQASELLGGPANTLMPVILEGDFNSDGNGKYSPDTYALLTHQGHFTDAWRLAGDRSRGLTWGHDELLSDPSVRFLYRLDLVLSRGREVEATNVTVVDPLIRRTAPLWFSDHAAVFARFSLD